jgi:hypothetical protein
MVWMGNRDWMPRRFSARTTYTPTQQQQQQQMMMT